MIRAGLVLLAVAQGAAGLAQLVAPRFFYDDVPTSATPWISPLPPYNEHLMRDVGALTLAIVLVLASAAIWPEPRLVRVALAANLVFTTAHLVFHATHLDNFPTGSAIGQTIALGVGVLLPAALFVASFRQPASR